MPKKSKYDLSDPAYLKVPRDMFERLVKKYGLSNWAETSRDTLDADSRKS